MVRSKLAKCAVLSAGIVFGFSAFSADDTSLTDLVNFKVSSETLDASKLSAIRENGLAAGVQGALNLVQHDQFVGMPTQPISARIPSL
ncbi:MAG: hypothetical protein HO274_05090 [Ferrovum myxofaciens]|uniref:hypothetical protein n=1 Tax=Ferrovum myxofaciens TaxID=416213 RepID=UPI0023571380|nr:hypothetical protein [Ferrovum myxofaciens]QKE40744.1 MAG: hypothetical protein HO274_05090 [Ferrovum myxofaciens]